MRKISVLLVMLMLLLTGCGGNKVGGTIEAEVYSYYAEVSGKIIELPVSLGQAVKKGDVLAVIDSTDAAYALEQAEQTLTKAESALTLLDENAEPEQIRQSRNQVTIAEQNAETAEANYNRLKQQYEKNQLLLAEDIISQYEMDEMAHQLTVAENALASANAQLDTARQQLALMQKSTATDSQRAMAEADVKQAENQLKQLTENMDKYVIKAGCDGRILSLSYTEGKLISAGSALLDISADEAHYWVGYVPAAEAEQMFYDQVVTIKTDEVEERAVVSYIDITSQYAPKDYQSNDNQNQKSVKVKCLLNKDSEIPVGKTAVLFWE